MAAALLLAHAAGAHGVGLSRGDYTVSGREVTSRLVFARHEAALLAAESASDAVVGLALAQRTRIMFGGRPCLHTLERIQRTEADGLELMLRHSCPAGGDAAFHFDFVGALDPGHRHVAELHDGPSVTTFVAYKGNADTTLKRGTESADTRPALGFLWLGVEHILTGWDHLLFLLGVALLPWRTVRTRDGRDEWLHGPGDGTRAKLRTLVLSVSAFTVAHSITLTLGVLGIAPLAPSWVEPIIALSIAAVGLEALFMKSAAAPHFTTFAFGLIHGMGFAGALVELELGKEQLPVALGLFNVGVELGQLAALAPVVLGLTLAARSPRLFLRVLPATGIVLALSGVTLFGVRLAESIHALRTAARAAAPSDASPQPATDPGGGGPKAVAGRLCAALHELPRQKRAECQGRPPGISVTASCNTQLSRSIASGAIAVDPRALDACIADISRHYDTCAFIAEPSAARPASCSGVLAGTRQNGAICRSSLECIEGHVCDGASALDPGVCRPPRKEGNACGHGIDPLAGYVHAVAGEERPECEGACIQNQCRAPA